LLHPIMPFITEELWAEMSPARAGPLITAEWPGPDDGLGDGAAAEMEWVVGAISEIRAVRAEMNVPPAARIPLLVKDADETAAARLETHRDIITTMARLTSIARHEGAIPDGEVKRGREAAVLILPLAGVVDVDKEKARLQGELRKLEGEIDRLDRKLANEDFLAKAPAEVVEEQRERRAATLETRDKVAAALKRLAEL
ncbi:MAG: class I tRNA ligase family protein, partial [Proteobacteria bacterium]|nr:class I tRNA ligase family protein [Pseudomonadota bacterium]